MKIHRRFAALFAVVAALGLAPGAGATADKAWTREARAARTALEHSAAAGYVSAAEQARYLGILSHARVVRNRVPPARARLLDTVLGLVARPKSPTGPRALVLYSTLKENVDYLARHRIPGSSTDVVADDGVVYRFFDNQGLTFHPLANASRLNALLKGGRTDEARTLAAALSDRLTPRADGAAVWEYMFDFGNAKAPWSSGMAQAVMAQALARVGRLDLARNAYRAIPGILDRELAAGPWIRLYSSTADTVLNAQLQSAISIADYAELAGDDDAAEYSDRLLEAAKAMLPRFDTGHWSRYSLRTDATLGYQDYVIDLLKALAKRTGDEAWSDAVARFELYETQPPELTGASVTPVVYPRPEDGIRDELVVRFWLSKPAQVAIVVDGKALDGFTAHSGWHTFRLTPRNLGPGTYPVRLVAQSVDGHPGASTLPSFTVARDSEPPALAAAKANGRVFWRAKDGESACCKLRLELRHGSELRVVPLAKTKGAAAIPHGYWLVAVIARDAAGNATRTELGLVIGSGKRR